MPTRHGFDEYLGLPYSNDMWPNHPEASAGTYPPLPLFDGEKVISRGAARRSRASHENHWHGTGSG